MTLNFYAVIHYYAVLLVELSELFETKPPDDCRRNRLVGHNFRRYRYLFEQLVRRASLSDDIYSFILNQNYADLFEITPFPGSSCARIADSETFYKRRTYICVQCRRIAEAPLVPKHTYDIIVSRVVFSDGVPPRKHIYKIL